MTSTSHFQRNPYKGRVPRAWVRLRFEAPDGTLHERELLADTGSPCAIIIGRADLNSLVHAGAAGVNSNFGFLTGGWLELQMPELSLVQPIHGYGSDSVAQAVKRDSSDFSGLVGLPLLRLMEYGGDADWFWLRQVPSVP
jgi:hypothetical protein